MKNERYLIKKIFKICIFPIIVMIGLTFIMGFYYEQNVYVKLNNVTVELGDKLPDEVTNYFSLLTDRSNLVIESGVPLDEDGNTTIIGKYNYYLAYNDESYRFSRLTNAKSTITVVDTTKPILKAKENNKFNYGSKISASDIAECFDLSGCEMTMQEEIDTNKSGEYEVNIIAKDGASNTNSLTTKIVIKEKPKPKPVYNAGYQGSFKDIDNHNNNKNASLSEDEKSNLRWSIVEFAKRFIGNPYVYGGTSLTNGADCSGFTMSVFANFGYNLPRVAASQGYVGKAISASELQPGDLVVYLYAGGGGHASIYAGNGMIVHAANARDGIILAPMFDGYRVYRRVIY